MLPWVAVLTFEGEDVEDSRFIPRLNSNAKLDYSLEIDPKVRLEKLVVRVRYKATNADCDKVNTFEGVRTGRTQSYEINVTPVTEKTIVNFSSERFLGGYCSWKLSGISIGLSDTVQASISKLLPASINPQSHPTSAYSCVKSGRYWCFSTEDDEFNTQETQFIVRRIK